MASGFLTTCSHGGVSEVTTGTEIALDFSTITTGKGIQLDLDIMTTGTGIEVRADADILTTGYFIRCLGGSAMSTEVFAIGDGANTAQDVVRITNTGTLTSSYATLGLLSTSAGTVGPVVTFNHDSASPAANDVIGRVNFYSDDSLGTSTLMAKIDGVATGVTHPEENGEIQFYVTIDSTSVKSMWIDSSGLNIKSTGTIGGTGVYNEGAILKNLKTTGVEATGTGAGLMIEIELDNIVYYFKAYPGQG